VRRPAARLRRGARRVLRGHGDRPPHRGGLPPRRGQGAHAAGRLPLPPLGGGAPPPPAPPPPGTVQNVLPLRPLSQPRRLRVRLLRGVQVTAAQPSSIASFAWSWAGVSPRSKNLLSRLVAPLISSI